jgi:hypothetical protein
MNLPFPLEFTENANIGAIGKVVFVNVKVPRPSVPAA